jgi:Tfp pilus assembly protein PilN
MKNRRLLIMLLGIIGLLLIPAIAMLFTNEVNWSIADFVIMGTLLLAVALVTEFITRKISNKKYRIAFIALLIALFLLLWVELAVGIFNSPIAGS